MAQFPQVLNNFNLYTGVTGAKFIGVGTVKIPKITPLTQTVKLAGMSGEIELPVLGQLASTSATISTPTLTKDMVLLAVQDAQLLTARGAIQMYDAAIGRNKIVPLTVVMRGTMKNFEPGQLEKGAGMDSSVEIEVDYLMLMVDGMPYLLFDKWNNLYTVGGVNYLAEVNAAI
ncbi:MAG TPA: phage major tail tube protein [Armatimonadota bacterium]|jgi:hypothetical protein